MKKLTYAQFMNDVEVFISKLSAGELKTKIMDLAENQEIPERERFLKILTGGLGEKGPPAQPGFEPEISSKKLIERIKKYGQCILDGEFFDEEAHWRAMEREDHHYWDRYNDYYDEQIDFSREPYVLEAIELLEEAKKFFRKNDMATAFEAYELLFDIFEHPDNSDEEYFIYGFSFEDALGEEIYVEHKTMYLRCLYVELIKENNLGAIYASLKNQDKILLSDIVEIARGPLPRLNEVIDGLIEHLKINAQHDRLLIDTLLIKGGMEEIKNFAYTHGKDHPPVFLYYYQYAKGQKFRNADLLQIILDGLKIIPEKYQTRSILSFDLIALAKKIKDNKNLTAGYATAFYSDLTLRNLIYFLDHIISGNIGAERAKLTGYLSRINVTKRNSYGFSCHDTREDIYSLTSSDIDCRTVIIGRYILEGIEPFLNLVKPENYLGFSGQLKYVAVITSLVLKSISQSKNALVIDALVDHYCCDELSDGRSGFRRLILQKAVSLPSPKTHLLKTLNTIEMLAIKRVSHILGNKLRGGYESACLLLVACAEAKEILGDNGNKFVQNIDTQFKRFSAFRRPLKDLTARSKYLLSIGKGKI